MDVRRAADRRGIAKLRRHEAHRQRDVALRLALRPRRTQLGEDRCRTQRRSPRAKVLRTVVPHSLPEIGVDVAGAERSPPTTAPVREHARTGCPKLPRDEPHECAISDDLPLPDLPLSTIDESNAA